MDYSYELFFYVKKASSLDSLKEEVHIESPLGFNENFKNKQVCRLQIEMKYFLGIKITHAKSSIFLSQQNYVPNL